jgi:hypothetical protein
MIPRHFNLRAVSPRRQLPENRPLMATARVDLATDGLQPGFVK